MYLPAHAGVGWLIGVATPGSDRRLRAWCVTAAVIPDVDTVAYLGGPDAYDAWHHTFGHNIFLGMILMAAAAWHHRGRPVGPIAAAVLVGLAFCSHLLGDMQFSAWQVPWFWPVSGEMWDFPNNLPLKHPVNIGLTAVLMIVIAVLPLVRQVTPFELINPRLDVLVLNTFRRKTLACSSCSSPCNNRCDRCQGAVCGKHSKFDWRFTNTCPACLTAPDA